MQRIIASRRSRSPCNALAAAATAAGLRSALTAICSFTARRMRLC
jgi:hypothetical protein